LIDAVFSPVEAREGRIRDRALFNLAIDSKLRGCAPKRAADVEN
jgi:hypothetical protein